MIFNMVGGGGGSALTLPTFTYTGDATLTDEGDGNWRIKFTTSGTFVLTSDTVECDVFVCGGGGAGGHGGYGNGGGGGYTTNTVTAVQKNQSIAIVVGAGGTTTSGAGNDGEDSSFGSIVAHGGKGGAKGAGGHGGDGGSGGGRAYESSLYGSGGVDGSYGGGGGFNEGHAQGQGTTTREFGEYDGLIYSGGGGSAYSHTSDPTGGRTGQAGMEHRGGGGGGCGSSNSATGGAGGSGIVIIRNHRQPKTITIPDTYKRIEYVQGDGSCCFNINVNASLANNLYFRGEFMLSSTSNQCILSSVSSSATSSTICKVLSNNWALRVNESNIGTGVGAVANTKFSMNGWLWANYPAYDLWINDSRVGYSTATSVSNQPLMLLGNGRAGTYSDFSTARVYWFRMYSNGELVRDFIPVKEIATEEAMLYDLANNVAYSAVGGGTMIAGDEV